MTVLENESQNTMYISSIHLKADLIGNLPLASSFFLKKNLTGIHNFNAQPLGCVTC